MKTYKVSYSGNSTDFKDFSDEVNANSEREAVEIVFQKIMSENYFPQEDGSILNCTGHEIADANDKTIEYDGGYFSAECIDLVYKVSYNFENGTSETIQEFDNLEDAIRCFDKAEITSELEERGADEIEIKKFRGEDIEEFYSDEVPSGYAEFIATGWFIKVC